MLTRFNKRNSINYSMSDLLKYLGLLPVGLVSMVAFGLFIMGKGFI